MSSFQFPANPSDGDIVVRGNLQAFYNAATNTWRVSEVPTAPGIPGPPGPPGPIGPEGKGVEVSGIVDTFADLPATNAHQFEYWVVSDTNTLYISDGLQWVELGGPIQGPPGDPGEDGNDGSNGQNGRGWYDTNIIDERPNNYQVQFLSNDGLGFTTDNILGPQGETGSLQVATEDTLGGIKIGRGLTILPDGTAQAGKTYVNLETVPLGEDGAPVVNNFNLQYMPRVFSLGEAKDESWLGPKHDYKWSEEEVTVQMPTTADRALVYFFSGSTMYGNSSFPGTTNAIYAFRAYVVNELLLTNAEFSYGRADAMAFQKTHNMTIGFNSSSIANRYDVKPGTKINEISFDTAAEVTFKFQQILYRTGNVRMLGGLSRLIVVPFRSSDADNPNPFNQPIVPFQQIDDTYYFRQAEGRQAFDDIFPPATPEEINAEASEIIQEQILACTAKIDANYPFVNAATQTELDEIKQGLYDLRNLPGTYEDIADAGALLVNRADALLNYQFRFE